MGSLFVFICALKHGDGLSLIRKAAQSCEERNLGGNHTDLEGAVDKRTSQGAFRNGKKFKIN